MSVNLSNNREDNGPNELADAVVDQLRTAPSLGYGFGDWLSETELRRLIGVSFFASLAPEEGRYPRCSLYWSKHPHEFFDTCEFRGGITVAVEKLRRLAPICQTPGAAIRVAMRGNELQFVGMTATRFEGLDFSPGLPGFGPIGGGGAGPCVQVHILAPGHIRVEVAGSEIELRAGEVTLRQFSDLWGLPCVHALATEFATSVANETISRLNLSDEECKLFGGLLTCLRDDKLLELVLRPILERGHGGTLVVIPDRKAPWLSSELSPLTEVAGLSLLDRAVEHLSACVRYHQPGGRRADLPVRVKSCLTTRGRVAVAARTIADLASVDGCVVLDRSLSVVAFGTKINVGQRRAEDSQIQFFNSRTKTKIELRELEKEGGMRLRSALWLCKAHPNVVAFVVSQDKTLKVMWSEDAVAFAHRRIAIPTIAQFA